MCSPLEGQSTIHFGSRQKALLQKRKKKALLLPCTRALVSNYCPLVVFEAFLYPGGVCDGRCQRLYSYLDLLSHPSHHGCHLCHPGLGSRYALEHLPSNLRRPPWAAGALAWCPGHDWAGLVAVEELPAAAS